MSKFKVGDKVKIRLNPSQYGSNSQCMNVYEGETRNITALFNDTYYCLNNTDSYIWDEDSLEKVNTIKFNYIQLELE